MLFTIRLSRSTLRQILIQILRETAFSILGFESNPNVLFSFKIKRFWARKVFFNLCFWNTISSPFFCFVFFCFVLVFFFFFFFFVNRILSTLSLLMDLRYHRPYTDIGSDWKFISRKTVASLQAGTTRSRKDHSIEKLSRKKGVYSRNFRFNDNCYRSSASFE